MAGKKSIPSEEEALMKVEPIAKLLGKTATQLWKMFVMRYVAKGVAQIFLAVFLNWVAYIFLWHTHKYYMLIFLTGGGILVYDAIQLLFNPYYFAMNDVLYRLKNESHLWSR